MIYIDASRYNSTAKRTGVENYSYFLINELVRQFDAQIHLISPQKLNLEAAQSVIPFPRFWTHLRLSWFVLNKRINNLFVPSHVLPIICPSKSIITIHDVAFKRYPESYSLFSRWYLDWSARFALKKALAIITPSLITKKDLIDFYNADASKIHVIPLGVNQYQKNKNQGFNLSEYEEERILKKYLTWPSQKLSSQQWDQKKIKPAYFLYVGRVEHKKNTDTLLKAFELFHQKHPDVFLIVAGFKGIGGEEIMAMAKNLPLERIIFTGYITEKEKHVLFKHAHCFVFPSRYEGFGLPLLEAMKYKLPLIASNIPSSKEILGEEAYFFETEDHEELARKMEQVLKQPLESEKWIRNYEDKLKNYSWKQCAKKTMEVLRMTIGKKVPIISIRELIS